MLKLIIVTASLLVSASVCSTSIDEYLLQASDRAFVIGLNSTVNTDIWRSSWVDNTEFRIQYEEAEDDSSSETYRLRLRPKYGSERIAEKALYTVSTEQHLLYENKVLGSDLLQRYLNVIEIVSLQLDIKHLQNKRSLFQLELKTERTLSKGNDFDAEKLQSLVLDLDYSATQLKLTKKRLHIIVMDLQVTVDDGAGLLSELITPGRIQSTMRKYKTTLENIDATPVVRMAQLDKNFADARLELQRSQQGFGIELLELKYEDKDNSAVAFTVGIRLPSGNNASDLQRHLDKSKADSKYRMASNDVQTSLRIKRAEIDWDYIAWQEDQQALEKIRKLMVQPSRMQNPILITGLRQQQLELNRKLSVVHIRLLKNYIALLDLTGLLSQYPLKNWLHVGLPALAGISQSSVN